MNVLRFTKYTNTTKFILPLLFNEGTKYHELFNNFFINAYIADVANKSNDDKIHLLFADYPSLTLTKNITETTTEYKYGDGFVLVCPLEDRWVDDYYKLITGKYSTISVEAKNRIQSFWDEDDNSLLYGVLHKKGKSVQKFLQEVLRLKHVEQFTKSKEWWFDFKIPEEILGLV